MIIWIASYPKSGNTWVRSFLTAYYFCDNGVFDINKLNRIEDYPNKQFFKEQVKDGEIHNHWDESQKAILKKKEIRFLKTHNSLIKAFGNDFTKPEYSLGVIYIIRDPRNVITSVKNHNDFNSYDEALKFMQNENAVLSDYKHLKNYAKTTIINSWRINYQSWLRNNSFRKMAIKYEDMVKNPDQIFRNLIIFTNAICKFNKDVDEKKIKYTKIVLNSLNPIISKYVEENSIDVVLPKKNIIIAKKNLDITNIIMDLLNNQLKQIDFRDEKN